MSSSNTTVTFSEAPNLFEAGKVYMASVIAHPCCGLKYCNCKPTEVKLLVQKTTKDSVFLEKVPEMFPKDSSKSNNSINLKDSKQKRKSSILKRYKVYNGRKFNISLVDTIDMHKRFVKTEVWHSDIVDEDDVPFSMLAKRMQYC